MLIHLNLGSNVEPRQDHLRRALAEIAALPQVSIVGCSRIYETAPAGMSEPGAGPFYNMGVAVRTSLMAQTLLERTQAIERRLGRPAASKGRKVSRTIDIDIVLAEDLVLHEPALTLPHPELATRSFFLWPLLEISPNASSPHSRRPLRLLLVRRVDPPILATHPAPVAPPSPPAPPRG